MSDSPIQSTPFLPCHEKAGAKLIEFAGWQLPVHYGSLTEEHAAVREDAGVFDVSHMTIVDFCGTEVIPYLRRLLANDIQTLHDNGKALYSCMLNEEGGVIDDLICTRIKNDRYRIVVNAATRSKDLSWFNQQAKSFQVTIQEQPQLAMLAVQGPNAIAKAMPVLRDNGIDVPELGRFYGTIIDGVMVSRTGYTGEDGFELAFDTTKAQTIWDDLIAAGVRPCGLGARDSLRLEAGMALYGNDLDEAHTPLESGLKWTVNTRDETRQFIGRSALESQLNDGIPHRMIGVALVDKGILRAHQEVHSDGGKIGELTSGGFSPTLRQSIGLARIKTDTATDLSVVIRKKALTIKTVPYPFYKDGNASFT